MGCGSSVLLPDRSKASGCESSVLLVNSSKANGCGSPVLLVDRSTNTDSERPTSNESQWSPEYRQFEEKFEEEIRKRKLQGFVYKWVSVTQRRNMHEQIAMSKKIKRLKLNTDKLEAKKIEELELCPLKIPASNHNDEPIKAYTADNIGSIEQSFFKYGKKIYSLDRIMSIIEERMDECHRLKQYPALSCTTVYITEVFYDYRYHGYRSMNCVSRKELVQILSACQLGVWVEPPRSEILKRMKEDVASVFVQPFESAYSKPGTDDSYAAEEYKHFHDQLLRWLNNYPNNIVYNVPPQPHVDPNKQVFPLPKEIQADKTILRKWLEVWEPFDCELPEDGAWKSLTPLNEDWQVAETAFAELVKTNHGDESLEPFDTTIEGNVAWTEIEMDIVKNDITTKAQDEIWKKRATRTNLNDPVWMADRREALAWYLEYRFTAKNKPYPYSVEDFMNFAEVLEKHWVEFQRLCIYYRPRTVQH